MSKFQLFDAVSLTEPIAQNILFHCGTGETPVHHLRLKYSLTTQRPIAQNTTRTNYLPKTTASVLLAKAGRINSSFSSSVM